MTDWWVHALECADPAARDELMAWFEREHPVAFPDERYSVVAEVRAGDGGTTWADYAWVGRYLYVATRREVDLLDATMGRWERAAVAAFDAESGTAEAVTLVLDPDAGGDDEVAGGRFGGVEGLGGMGVLHSLAMVHQFRFRSYAGVPPARHGGPGPDAFTVVDAVDTFAADMAEATGVEPTDEGLAFLRADPADDDRYVFGETYGPVDHEFDLDATAPLADGREESVESTPEDLPEPADVLAAGDRPDPEFRESGSRGLLERLRRLLGR